MRVEVIKDDESVAYVTTVSDTAKEVVRIGFNPGVRLWAIDRAASDALSASTAVTCVPASLDWRPEPRFAAAVVRQRGRVSPEQVQAVRTAGYSDAQVLDILLAVALNTFTNYVNEVAQTEIDFPVAQALAA